MTVYNPGNEAKINDILTILGVTKRSFWPFYEGWGELVTCIGAGDLIPSETAGAAEDLSDDFSPVALGYGIPFGIYSYHFHPTGDHHLAGIDHGDYSFAAAPFSVGAWIRPTTVVNNTIVAKYDVAGTDREFRFWIDAAGKLNLELYDDTANASEIAVGPLVTQGQMQHVVATYDGVLVTPTVKLYVNGALVTSVLTETGLFIDIIPGATPLTVACSGVTALPTNEFHGRIALPFLTGKALTAAEVLELYTITVPMVGIF